MPLDIPAVKDRLKSFDFVSLFTQELGWNFPASRKIPLSVTVKQKSFDLQVIAQKRSVPIFLYQASEDDEFPDYAVRRAIHKEVRKSAHEHLIIFVDAARTTQIWQWVAHRTGQPAAYREQSYSPATQSGEALILKLATIAVPISEEEAIDLTGAVQKLRDAFDRDKVTKKFYDRFKVEHPAFLKFIKGIKDQGDREWYTSLMLNRLMFVYFIQKKGFLDGDINYLRNRMKRVYEARGKDKFQSFYRYFLVRLFHDGLGKHENDRKLERDLEKLLGKVPYLNGGFFEVHQLEERNADIDIPDKAFEKLFDFFDEFDWHLDDRPIRDGKEINPDVVGYIFEQYINKKQMGAYYTKEDITEYISKNTIIPYLFDAAKNACPDAFKPESSLWQPLREEPDRYIYAAVRHGVIDEKGDVIPLPKEIEAGIRKVEKREKWNRSASQPFALPTETWREHVARRQRCLELREKLQKGDVHEINEMITLNLDIWQFARDAIVNSEEPKLLRAFWQAIQNVTVLDPTCGSGAFLFAALRILETLYSDCLERMERFIQSADSSLPDSAYAEEVAENPVPVVKRSAKSKTPQLYSDFRNVLGQISERRGPKYFILKSIIINNLFGVDIMEEAVEICKLRLFLKLAAQVETFEQIEPLPDIDFNIRTGNTLVGYVTVEEIRNARVTESAGRAKQKLLMDDDADAEIRRIEEEALVVKKSFDQFRDQQTKHGGQVTVEDKKDLRQRLAKLDGELDIYLAGEYGIDLKGKNSAKFDPWKTSHQPFHWFVHFYGIMSHGGFDVIVGNPPYVEKSKLGNSYSVNRYLTNDCRDIYAWCVERSIHIHSKNGRLGLIVPVSIASSENFAPLRNLVSNGHCSLWMSHFANRPGQLFAGAQSRLTIVLRKSCPDSSLFSTRYYRWDARNGEREFLMPSLLYASLPNVICSFHGLIPKVGQAEAVDFLEKIMCKQAVSDWLVKTSAFPIYWVRVPGYFCQFFRADSRSVGNC